MAIAQTAHITPELKRRLLDFKDSTGPLPLEAWLQNLVAASNDEDEDIAFWVSVTHGLHMSTVAAHLESAGSYAAPSSAAV